MRYPPAGLSSSPRHWRPHCACGSILPASAQDLPPTPPVILLTGNLTGWTADRTRARVEAGVVRVESGDGWLRFDRVLADFVLTMDVRLPSADAKAGIFVRSWPTFDSKMKLPNNAYRVVASQRAGIRRGRVVAMDGLPRSPSTTVMR